MYTYGREAVYGNIWDSVTRKCRGIVFNTETGDIVARPFEKFHNIFTAGMPETDPSTWTYSQGDDVLFGEPEVWEKMDGFLATLYEWEGKQYIASKGSFDSPHAKWATGWVQARTLFQFPTGYTPVFEGISPNFRIVVDYKFEGLVLLALIHNETGEELSGVDLVSWAELNNLNTPSQFPCTWQEAAELSNDESIKNQEGYVLCWRRPGTTPFRLKVKYTDYCRLHKMIATVSPKAIFKCLSDGTRDDLVEWTTDSLPWFNRFVTKWVRAMEYRYNELSLKADGIFHTCQQVMKVLHKDDFPLRKEWAEMFLREENKEVSAVLFGLLDGKDVTPILWKMVRPLIHNSHPMVDVHNL